ncbi:HTH domain-containing protein [Reichenbachiella sp. 5M10]|uniref:HTH domain-containing protein n=1 Tax=Reichenbachiella sp. 5M10 TaxID=1889772 RepID=UPI000C145668|nr:HTH domain-containing protein [Reichenbachiella sp. 5M10]
MDYFSYWKHLEYTLELIQRGRLASPRDLTEKFDCSERTVRKMINDLRRKGHNIKYSRRISKYVIES